MSVTPSVARWSLGKSTLRIMKLCISILYFAAWSGYRTLRKRRVGTGVVLYYHNVPGCYQDKFRKQMKFVARKARPVAVTEICSLAACTHSVAITFDDGLLSFFENAVPILCELSIPALVFVVTEALGGKPNWGNSYYDSDERIM